MDQIDDATIAEIKQELSGDGVWIAPSFARAHEITAADEAAIEEAVASVRVADMKVVLVDVDHADERFQGNISNLTAWLYDDTGEDATYVGYAYDGVRLLDYGEQPSTSSISSVARHEHPEDAVGQVLRAAELLESGNADKVWEAIPREERYPWIAEEQEDGVVPGLDAGSGALWGIGAALVLGAVVVGVIRWRRRRLPPGFTLPRTVLHTVRAAEDRRLRTDAEAEVLALGEALGSGQPVRTPPTLDSWQRALDHYAAARSILLQEATPADVVGALVLARRGEDARGHAQGGGGAVWQPPTPCWFNPLHEGSTSVVKWRDGAREVDVPACPACEGDLAAGREPGDVLDFIEDDKTVHYYRLDLGAWTTTGYGALDADLLGALRASRRGLSAGR